MILFALPVFFSSVLQQLFNTVDMSVVGRFVGDDAQAAVGCTATIVGLFIDFFSGFSVGVNVVAAHCIGKKNGEGARQVLHTAVLFSLICGIFIAIGGILIAKPMLVLMNTPTEILDTATLYLKIYFLGMPFYTVYNFCAAVFIAQGNSKTPLVCLSAGGALNVLLNLLFVCVLHTGVAGVAIATVAANSVSVAAVLFMHAKNADMRLQFKELKINPKVLKKIIVIGMPSALLSSVFSVSNIFVQSAVNSLGVEAVAASTDAAGIEIYVQFIGNAFATAARTFVGQNAGANNLKRCDKAVSYALTMCVGVTLLLSGGIYLLAPELLRIFTADPTIIAIAMSRMKFTLLFKAVQSVMDITAGCLQGYGYTLIPALISVFGVCGVRLLWIFFVFPRIMTMGGLMVIYPITQGIAAALDVVCYLIVRKKKRRESMENRKFNVAFDGKTGGVSSIVVKSDENAMEWIKSGHSLNVFCDLRKERYGHADFELTEFSETEDYADAVFKTADLTVEAHYSFNAQGNLVVKNVIKNPNDVEFFLLKGQIGLSICFFDDYCDAEVCMTKRCHTHIWCGGDTSYICLLKMGDSEHNLGVKFLRGGLCGYEQIDAKTNDRGMFIAYPDFYILKPHESYAAEYEIFTHKGKTDFIEKIKNSPECAFVDAENTTLFAGEKFNAKVYARVSGVTLDGEKADAEIEEGDGYSLVSLAVEGIGEHKIEFTYNDNRKTFAVINVSPPFAELLHSRVRFIAEKQQYNCTGSKLDGAFLIYDNEEKKQYFDNVSPDLNASRERQNMGFLLARYLRHYSDDALLAAFKKYIAFIEREIFDEKTGEVFNTVGRYSEFKRLYNGPNMARLFLETFYVLNDKKYLRYLVTIMKFYYGNGGAHFYPNGICMYEMLEGLKIGGMTKEYEWLKSAFTEHIDNVIARGLKYPAHEVNYEQTIVSPAVSFILDGYRITGDKKYLSELPPHLNALERFDGFQPHYKTNGMAIRFWDDYWFGKSATFGDTMPHQCSALSLSLYFKYGRLSGNKEYAERAISRMRNMLCLFKPDGAAHCASVFPFRVNGNRGEFLDGYANDQDSILYLLCDVFLSNIRQ